MPGEVGLGPEHREGQLGLEAQRVLESDLVQVDVLARIYARIDLVHLLGCGHDAAQLELHVLEQLGLRVDRGLARLPLGRLGGRGALAQPRDVLRVDQAEAHRPDVEVVLQHELRVRTPVDLRARQQRQAVEGALAPDLDALRRLGIPHVHAGNVGRLAHQAEEVALVAPVVARRVIEGIEVELVAPVVGAEVVDLDPLPVAEGDLAVLELVVDQRLRLDRERQPTVAVGELQWPLLRDVAQHVDRELALELLVGLEGEVDEQHLAIRELHGILAVDADLLLGAAERKLGPHVTTREAQPALALPVVRLELPHVAAQLVQRHVHAREHGVDLRLARPVGVQREDLGQHVVGHPRPRLVHAVGVGQAQRGDAEPLLVHVVLAFRPVEQVGLVGPRGIVVLLVEVLRLQVLPPLVAPLEHEPADGVALLAVAPGLVVHLLPLVLQHQGLGALVLLEAPRIERVAAELEEHHGHVQLLVNLLPEAGEARPAVDVRAQKVHVLQVLGDQVDVLDVAVDDGERMVRGDGLALGDDLAEQAVQVAGLGRVLLALRQVLDLEAGPGQAVVALVAEGEHQHARDVLVGPDDLHHVTLERLARGGVRVVDERHPLAADAVAVTAHQRVDHRHDAVLAVDVGHPARRDGAEASDRVDVRRLHQAELVVEHLPDVVVRLAPQVVGVVLPARAVAPHDALDVEVLAVDLEPPALLVLVGGDTIGLRVRRQRRRERCREEQEPAGPGQPSEET